MCPDEPTKVGSDSEPDERQTKNSLASDVARKSLETDQEPHKWAKQEAISADSIFTEVRRLQDQAERVAKFTQNKYSDSVNPNQEAAEVLGTLHDRVSKVISPASAAESRAASRVRMQQQ